MVFKLRKSWSGLAITLGAFLLCQSDGAAENWPQFRGSGAAGTGSVGVPTTWDVEKGENILWKAPIPGLGHASPIIWGDRVYVATAISPDKAKLKVGLYGDIEPAKESGSLQWRLIAYSKETGKELWNTLGHEGNPRSKRHPKATHCNSTPVTDGKRIAALFASEGLFCFDMQGKLLWKKDLGPLDAGYFAVPSAQWGFASSPVIHEGRIIVQADVQKDSFLAAFDADTGRELWRTARKDVPTWGTPGVIETQGRIQVAVNGWHQIGGYDLVTGKELWHLDGGGDIPVPTPITAKGLIYFTSGHGKYRPMRAIRPDASGDITPPEISATNASIAWVVLKSGTYMQTPIVVGDLLFGCLDNGVLTCFDALTGQVHYSERLGTGNQGFTASPVASGGNLYFASEIGNVFVVAAQSRFAIVATNRMNSVCMATPALSNGQLFIRTEEQLVAIGRKK